MHFEVQHKESEPHRHPFIHSVSKTAWSVNIYAYLHEMQLLLH